MGEPQPGDFPDPAYIRTDNVLLTADQSGLAGGYVQSNNSAVPIDFSVVTTTGHTDGRTVLGGAIEQLQQAVSSQGSAANIVNAACFGVGSWFFGIANGGIAPNDYVMLSRSGTRFGFENIKRVGVTSAAVSSNVVTVTTPSPHGLQQYDKVSLVGFAPTAFNTELTVKSVTSATVFTADLTTTASTSTVGQLALPVTGAEAHAQFVKKSGATFDQGAAAGDICVFSMLKGGATSR